MSRAWKPFSVPLTGNLRAEKRLIMLMVPAVTAMILLAGCQEEDLLRPGDVETNVVVAVYMPPEDFEGNEIELDGVALEKEWGAPDDPTRPFTMIRASAEHGTGFPGDPKYVAVKAVYTDEHLFLLFQWTDPWADVHKDRLVYTGPDVPEDHGGRWEPLVDPENWSRDVLAAGRRMNEDRLVLAFEMESAGDDRGAFSDHGCQIACHPGRNPQFGRPGYGRLDVWQWMSTRTNWHRNLFVETDHPMWPRFGIPGYLDDFVMEPVGGLTPDPGRAGWFRNWQEGTSVPKFVYRPSDDTCPTGYNHFGEECKVNNGLIFDYLWRERLDQIVAGFGERDVTNHALAEPRLWETGDHVSGYYFSYPDGSRADVRGKGQWDERELTWTLEIGRSLNTGDRFNDVIFQGSAGEEVVFTVCVMDNATERHWGSAPQILRFGPRPGAGGKLMAGDAGGGRDE